MRRIFGALPLLLIAIGAAGQDISVGSNYYTQAANLTEKNAPAVRTEINPKMATANGRLESVHVYWTNYNCSNRSRWRRFSTSRSAAITSSASPGDRQCTDPWNDHGQSHERSGDPGAERTTPADPLTR